MRRPVPLSLGRETHGCYGVHAIDLNVATCKGQDGESYEGNHHVHLSAMIQCFSLKTKQHQSAYKPKKQSSEHGECFS